MESQSLYNYSESTADTNMLMYIEPLSLTGLAHRTSEQHIEFGGTLCKRDFDGLTTITNWIIHHIPFDVNKAWVHSI